MTGLFRERVRFGLSGLRARNGHFDFEHLCRALARVTISPNIVAASGPVSSAGDQGRDFETYASEIAGVGVVGRALGVGVGDQIVFVCTLQQRDVARKILADVAVLMAGPACDVVVAYCEIDIAVGIRHGIEAKALEEFGVMLTVFDGTAIADELTFRRDELADAIARYLDVGEEGAGVGAPRRLPPAPLLFVNREAELGVLNQVLESSAAAVGPTVAVLVGMHGVGKSAMGAHWANSVRDQFPDGDLYVDFGPRVDPMAPDVGDVLGVLLRDLGVAGAGLPEALDDRRRLFAQLTASRRLLMFVDNVADPAQVLATLPVGGGSMVVVASNSRLEELIFEGARLVEVEPLDVDAAIRVLAEIAGRGKVDPADQEVAELVGLCGGLPIAVAVCGGFLATRREASAKSLVLEISGATDRLAAMSGPGRFSVAQVFEVAYQALGERRALVYRRIGLWRGPTVSAPVIAAMCVMEVSEAAGHLDALADGSLIERAGPDRFRVHVLIGLHMASAAAADENEAACSRARRAAVEWFYSVARAADFAVVAERLRLTSSAVEVVAGAPALSVPADAYGWFELERHNVMAAIDVAVELGMADRVWQFAEALWPLCATQKRFGEWVRSHKLAVEASVEVGDLLVEARMRSQLARAYSELGDHRVARIEMDAALVAVESGDHPRLGASVREFAGVCALAAGDYSGAVLWLRQARSEMAELGSTRGAALADYYAAGARIGLGELGDALSALERAEPVFVELGDDVNVGRVGLRRGEVLAAMGLPGEAMSVLEPLMGMLEELGLGFELAEVHELLAGAAEVEGWRVEALRYRQRAYQLYRTLGHPRADVLEVDLGIAS